MKMGAQVKGFSLECDDDRGLFRVLDVGLGIGDIGDIRDLDRLKMSFRSLTQTLSYIWQLNMVLNSYLDPVDTYQVNVLGTVNILEAVQLVGP